MDCGSSFVDPLPTTNTYVGNEVLYDEMRGSIYVFGKERTMTKESMLHISGKGPSPCGVLGYF